MNQTKKELVHGLAVHAKNQRRKTLIFERILFVNRMLRNCFL